MERKFLKSLKLKSMIEFLIRKLWIVILAGIVTMVLGAGLSIVAVKSNTQVTTKGDVIESIELIDGKYVYTTLINIKANEYESDVFFSYSSYLALMLSNENISMVIKNLDLTESFIDIFNKMSWEVIGENIKLKISSSVQEVDGYSWIQVLDEVVKQGEITIRKYYDNVQEVIIIDEPYMENAVRQVVVTSDVPAQGTMNVKWVIIAAFVGIVLSSAGVMLYYLLREKIMYAEEVEENLGIPVLAVVDKKCMK